MSTSRRCFGGCLVLASLLLAACGAAEDQPKRDQPPAPAQEAPLQDLTGTMDKARAVEDLTRERNESLDRKLEETEHPTPPADR